MFMASEVTWHYRQFDALFRELAFHPGEMLVVQS